MLLRPTKAVKDLLRQAIAIMDANLNYNDQHAMADLLRAKCHLLDEEEYPNGKVYFEEKRTSKAKMVHNNYLPTTEDKIWRFKQNSLWSSNFDMSKVNVHEL